MFNPQEEDKDLVHTLWRYTEQPIREALVASHMAAQLAALSRRGPEEYEARAKLYEGWAIGVLDQCTEAEARLVLQAQFAEPASVSNGTPVHLAVRLSRKAFLAHANTQSLLDAVRSCALRGAPCARLPAAHAEPSLGRFAEAAVRLPNAHQSVLS